MDNNFKLMVRADFAMLLDESRKKEQLTDVYLQIGDKIFPAHRMILSLHSPVLKAMISDQWSTSKICPISGEYVDPSIVEELLHFLYTGSIDLTPDNVHPVCVAAHFLQIATLLEPAVQHLCQLISVDNALTLLEFSLTCELERLRDSCLQFIVTNNHEFLKNSQILKLSVKNFKDLITELRDQYWDPKTNLRVNTLDCIVRWAEMNPSDRLMELPGLLKSIPLEELPDNILSGEVPLEPLVDSSTPGFQAVSAVQAVLKSEWEAHQNLIVFGEDPQKTGRKDTIQCYDWQAGSWNTLPVMLEPRRHFDCIIFNKRNIVVYGGVKPEDNLGHLGYSVEMFDWATQTWMKLADLPGDYWEIVYSLASLNGHLYAAGGALDRGFGQLAIGNILYCYSFQTQQWIPLASPNIVRERFQLVGCGNHLYAFGGETLVVEKYDPLLDRWSVLEQWSIDRYMCRATVHQAKIYARGNLGDLKMFDPKTDDWSSISSYFENGDLVSMNGKLVTLDKDKDIMEFDFSTGKWNKFFELDTKFDHLRIVAGKFY